MNYDLLTGADLAFVGDAYFELYIRNYVLHKGYTKLNDLHNHCVQYVSRTSQNKIILTLMNELTEEEISIFKRGRNFNYKNKDNEYIKEFKISAAGADNKSEVLLVIIVPS